MRSMALMPVFALLVGFAPYGQAPAMAPQKLRDAAPGATAPKAGDEVAVLDTSLGRIVLKFFPDKAPGHVKNFEDLARKGFYDGTAFHRVIKGFMVQGGDPLTKDDAQASVWGTGNPGYYVKAEFNDTPHTRGIVSMARSQNPDSAGSQFFIVHKDSKFLDNQYTVFGQVVDGMKTVDAIANTKTDKATDRPEKKVVVNSVKIETWPLSIEKASGH